MVVVETLHTLTLVCRASRQVHWNSQWICSSPNTCLWEGQWTNWTTIHSGCCSASYRTWQPLFLSWSQTLSEKHIPIYFVCTKCVYYSLSLSRLSTPPSKKLASDSHPSPGAKTTQQSNKFIPLVWDSFYSTEMPQPIEHWASRWLCTRRAH